jgi:hypothetical protein
MEGVDVFPGSASTSQASAERRVLVINLDTRWDFSLLCRRLALDLYRNREKLASATAPEGYAGSSDGEQPRPANAANQAAGPTDGRASNVDFWDVRDVPGQLDALEAENEKDSIWRHWPRSIRGGPKGAIAELEEKLAEEIAGGERKQIELLTVLAVASLEDAKRQKLDVPSRLEEFLGGLETYFNEQPRSRGSIQIVVALNNWDNAVKIPPLYPDRDPTLKQNLPDAVLFVSRSHMSTGEAPPVDRPGFQMKLLRIIVDLFRSEPFAKTFFLYANKIPGTVSVFRVDTTDYELHDRVYAASVMQVLRRKHANTQTDLSNPITGEDGPFIDAVNKAIFGDRTDATAGRELTDGSYKIVNEVTKDFDKRIFPGADRNNRLIRRRFDGFVRDGRPATSPPRWLFGHRWAQSPMLATWLEQAFVAFLQETQSTIQEKLAGQESQLSRLEERGVRERVSRVGRLPSVLTPDEFGTGTRGFNNARDARAIVDPEIADIEREISEFWEKFAEEKTSPVDDRLAEADIELLRKHCPLIKVEWSEAQDLLVSYRSARTAIAGLMSRLSPWLWIVVCVAICLQISLLWLGVWAHVRVKPPAIPALSHAIWIVLFLCALAGPFWVLKAGHNRVERALAALDQAAGKILDQIEERLADVVKYVAIIQRHHFLHRLRERIASLETEARLIDDYLNTVRASLGDTAEARAADINPILGHLHGLPQRRQWLDVALRRLVLEPEVIMQANLPGGESIHARSRLWKKSVTVRVEPFEPAP